MGGVTVITLLVTASGIGTIAAIPAFATTLFNLYSNIYFHNLFLKVYSAEQSSYAALLDKVVFSTHKTW